LILAGDVRYPEEYENYLAMVLTPAMKTSANGLSRLLP
jgi:hypothetical protein